MTGRVLFYVQHLLGVGHVKRAAAICSGMIGAGLDVTVAFGGMPVPGVSFAGAKVVLLPPVRSRDASFSSLVDENDDVIDDAWWGIRIGKLLELHDAVRPDLILVEHFPFGRRKFRRELIPLFERARKKPDCKIVGSVRDILVEPDGAGKTARVIEIARTWFDRILVHGDPEIIRLEDTFPAAAQIADLLMYTGYVVEQRDQHSETGPRDGVDEVIVSAGGGAVGETLFRTAHDACANGCLPGKTWRFLAGGNLDTSVVDDLAARAPANVIIEPARPDFPDLLACAALSISQAGYNTVMDILVARCPAIVVPFATGGETEQTFRAEKFEQAGLLISISECDLTAVTLSTATTTHAGRRTDSNLGQIDLDGAAKCGHIIAEMVTRHD